MEKDKSNDDSYLIKKCESGSIPDFLLRTGVCKLLHTTANVDLQPGGFQYFEIDKFINQVMRVEEDINIHPDKANEQHYELPTALFQHCLGDYMKYSCAFWQELEWHFVNEKPATSFYRDVITGTSSMTRDFEKGKSIRQLLTKAEENMMKIVMARMEMKDGHTVLDVGCGWGSASMYILQSYPKTKVVAISNSKTQREYIEKKAQEKGFSDRLMVFTTNVREFTRKNFGDKVDKFLKDQKFDRIHSTEMFEHMRNWEKLLNMLREDWVKDDGGMFLHVFAHKDRAYPYDDRTWMGKHFFMGGIMPAHDLLKNLNQTIGKSWELVEDYKVNGRHYAKTSEAWLKLFDQESKKIRKVLDDMYEDPDKGKIWFNRWRMFFIAVAEFFGFREGSEWFVSHYYMRPIKK